MPSTGAAEEIHDEENDGYDYDDDDFEVDIHVICCLQIILICSNTVQCTCMFGLCSGDKFS